ncbi:MAG: hypothetical protein QOI38_2241 [Sphingomonadales bacterium]|jgi:hypothetical protein|nr:hypothetical protein [Sphingomonadales bacterium]
MRPASIVNFERIVLLLIVIGLAGTVLSWDGLRIAARHQGLGETALIAVHVVLLALLLLLLWLIAHRRSAVAKWVWILLCLAGIAVSVPALGDSLNGPLPALLMQAAQWVLILLSIWMLLRPDAGAWFRGGPPAP